VSIAHGHDDDCWTSPSGDGICEDCNTNEQHRIAFASDRFFACVRSDLHSCSRQLL
jgi:hypothetical protein